MLTQWFETATVCLAFAAQRNRTEVEEFDPSLTESQVELSSRFQITPPPHRKYQMLAERTAGLAKVGSVDTTAEGSDFSKVVL